MVLLASEKLQIILIAKIPWGERHYVGRWRKRWQASIDALLAIARQRTTSRFTSRDDDVFRDAHRGGSPGMFAAE